MKAVEKRKSLETYAEMSIPGDRWSNRPSSNRSSKEQTRQSASLFSS